MEKKNINLGFRVTVTRQEELKILAAKRRQSVQEMIEEGLKLIVEGTRNGRELEGKPDLPKGVGQRSMANLPWHNKLEFVLNSRNADAITAVQSNLEVFYDYCGGKRTDGSPPSDSPRSHRHPKRVATRG